MIQRALLTLAAAVLVATIAGCDRLGPFGGGPDRAALARKAVETYWYFIGHGQVNQAYDMMTSGNRRLQKRQDYDQNMFGFVTSMAGVSVKTSPASVNGDLATVPVRLYSPKAPGASLKAYQHLFWEDGQWHISDDHGGLSRHA